MTTPDKHIAFRGNIVDSVYRELFGPLKTDPEEKRLEEIEVNPLQLYATGILFPQKTIWDPEESDTGTGETVIVDDSEDSEDLPEVDQGKTSRAAGADNVADGQPLNLANEFNPSALGITFRVKGCKTLTVSISTATYTKFEKELPHSRAGQEKADGSRYSDYFKRIFYKRKPISQILQIDIHDISGKLHPYFIDDTDNSLALHTVIRKTGNEQIISLMLVNENQSSAKSPAFDSAFYQAEFEVQDIEGAPVFCRIDRASGSCLPEEQASLDLLYRHRQAYALGHGCSGDWTRGNQGQNDKVTYVCTAVLPSYEVKPILPRETPFSIDGINLSMNFLCTGHGGSAKECRSSIISSLYALCEDYETWIFQQREELKLLNGIMLETASAHMENCDSCLLRMKEGVKLLAEIPLALQAFRIANRAMLMQQFHYSIPSRKLNKDHVSASKNYEEIAGKERKWRPFQLAFILMNIAGVVDRTHPERELVDIIWFPTGGGKTEAYLGLTAFVICLRRLRKSDDAGTTVLMRYTLRLLTAQQFQRASTLILALDLLRKENFMDADLGPDPISIGLWVGKSLSPNKSDDAITALRNMHGRGNSENPFQVLECPWCKADFTAQKSLGYIAERVSAAGRERTVRFRCPDPKCVWHSAESHLPIIVIDEDIYRTPPTLVLGTVDKFAQIAWDDRTGNLFGLKSGNSTPELIIQDELHLISGPLGTIVGLYESAIERFCNSKGITPKIVASTATIKNASQQCEGLYNRKTFEFPPAGLKAGDSYFAYEDQDAPGRLYLGVFASALKSHATAQVRTCATLLQSVMPATIPDPEAPIDYLSDPYGTLVWYFNSLRELGLATTMCTGDIEEFIKGLCKRRGIPWELRRRIWDAIEMTSRRTADEIPQILKKLDVPWSSIKDGNYPVDILLATNMISVGVDVPRLGMMLVTGQPKSTAEYIQATSRVGRTHPGLVVTLYHQGKSRDRSHYEQFVAYHQSIYRYVEPTSVTSFSPPARERALRGALVALSRQLAGVTSPADIGDHMDQVEEEVEYLLSRIRDIDADEEAGARAELEAWLDEWQNYRPQEYGKMAGNVAELCLMYPFGGHPDPVFQRDAWPIMTSMRSVDGIAEARVINNYIKADDEESVEGADGG